MARRTTRRQFLRDTTLAGVGFWVAGGVSSARPEKPADRLRIACVGVGGKGSSDTDQAANHGDIVALCDIDDKPLGEKSKKFPKALVFHDFRKLLDEMGKGIDALTISGPDVMHAVCAARAIKMGKHVYVQKPLTHTVHEARVLRELARQHNVCTQMGNQGTAANGLRRAAEFVQAGGIGKVQQIHVWTNRPIWPQAPKVKMRLPGVPVPENVHWDLFLCSAPERPYNPGYHPFAWRGWWDFGTGALGDMACHTANMAFMACKLGSPVAVSGECGDLNPETYPSWARVVTEFPARGDMPACTVTWYEGSKDGKNVLPPPELVKGQGERQSGVSIFFKDAKWQFKKGEEKPKVVSSGSFLIGDKAVLFSPDDYGAESYIVTESGVERLTGDPEKLPRNNHGDDGMKAEWARAIKEGKPHIAMSNFDYAGPLTEFVLLGNVAIRAGKRLTFDAGTLKFPGTPDADALLTKTYRKGFEL
jgi:predicted dehydrogenase